MSGHSKWSTIKRKKEKTDNQRAKIFTKIGREIAVAVREGGPDPASNSKLKDIISKAKANNVPNDNIDRIIKKAAGDGNADNYEEIMYEGYGPSGIAVIVETLTDNRNRTAGDMRHYFDKFGGNMGQSGCVSFMFSKQGVIVIEKDDDIDEEKLMDLVLDAGANDLTVEDGVAEVWADPENFEALVKLFEEKGIPTDEAELIRRPDMVTEITDPAIARQVLRLVERMEELDDVQLVTANYEIADSIADQLEEE